MFITLGQHTAPGPCPKDKYRALEDFDIQRFSGLWYEYGKTIPPPDYRDRCISFEYILNDEQSLNIENIYENPK